MIDRVLRVVFDQCQNLGVFDESTFHDLGEPAANFVVGQCGRVVKVDYHPTRSVERADEILSL